MKFFKLRCFGITLTIIAIFLIIATSAICAERGHLTGQVKDSLNNSFLKGVLVSSEDGQSKTVTDRSGKYSLSLPAGQYTITFSYLGYEPVKKSVEIIAGKATKLDVGFKDTSIMLGEIVVYGRASALNQQKNSMNLKNIVSSDAIGLFPDQNAAEALDRIPGVSIERDQGEGRFVIIRGIDPHLNSASVDGIPLASAEADTRAVLLDTLSMNVMESISLTKALTADMPADSIGGHIDIATPSAYDRSERTLRGSIGTNYSDLTDDLAGTGEFTYGDVFGDRGQVGFLISMSYDEKDFGSDNVEADPWEIDDNGFYTTEELQYREYNLTRERIGITTNLEFRPDDDKYYYIRGLYGSFTDHEYRQRTVIKDMFMSSLSNDSGMIYGEDYSDDSEELYPTTEILLKDREETQLNYAIQFGGENTFDKWAVDYKASYSYAEQDTPYDMEYTYKTDELNYTYSGATTDTPSVSVNTGDITDLDIFELDEVESSNQLVEEKAWIFAGNIKKELNTSFQSYIKTGVHISLRNKTSDIETIVYEDAPSGFDTLSGYTATGRSTYSIFPLPTLGLTSQFNALKSQFSSELSIEDSNVEDYETDEKVYAAYIMGEATIGRFSILPGLRFERTNLNAKGKTFDEETEEVGSQEKDNDYNNLMPGLHAKYNFNDNLVLYAAWTNTISRPQWEQTRYSRVTEYDDGEIDEVTVGNPDLDPYEAMNWDVTLSYYMPDSIGMISAGYFYKDIDKFIYEQTTDEGYDYDVTSFFNGDNGYIYGIELAYQQKLNFLPSPLDGFSLLGSLTLSSSEADVLASDAGDPGRTVDFVRHSDTVGIVALSYEKQGFFIRISGSYRSSYLDELGDDPLEDRYIDDHFQVDISSSYTFMDKYTIYLNLINLTDEPLKAYWGESGRLSQLEEYGWTARMGIKCHF